MHHFPRGRVQKGNSEMADNTTSGFVWYELMTGDLDQAVSFYSNVVGWDIRDSGMPGMRYMLFGKNGKDVGGMMSWSAMGMEKPPKWAGHIYTAGVDAETRAVVADGGKEHRAPQDIPGIGRFSVVADPQGAEYLLFQPNQTQMPPRLGPTEVGSVGWRELATTDWQKAWDFYSSHYGWTKDLAVDMGPMGTYQTFKLDDNFGGGMMSIPAAFADKMKGPAWLFYFTVEDIHAAAQRVKDHGGSITHGPAQVPGGSWILQGVDPQGAGFALTAAK
jgi:predicted enzyme related to lactoylglutathione lyase